MILLPPGHKRYAFHYCSDEKYTEYADGYSRCKRYGIRGVYTWASGAGVLGVVKDALKGTVINYGKRKLAGHAINGAVYICSPAVAVFTNATKVVKWTARAHSATAFVFECVEDSSNLVLLLIDLLLYGQPVPVGDSNRFNFFGNSTDFLDS